jgi:hypothetical protein
VRSIDELEMEHKKRTLVSFQITKLKIASNPFAKGFREATRTR